MSTFLEQADVVRGKGCELHIAPQGVAFTRGGTVPADTGQQAAEYSEIASVEIANKGRDLMIVFAGERATWKIPHMLPREAQWAQVAIQQAVQQARLQAKPSFLQRLSGDALAQELVTWTSGPMPDPSVTADFLLRQAALNRATDMHLRPEDGCVVVRFRVDGQLLPVGRTSPEMGARIAARLKVLAGMKTYQRNSPQTGRLNLEVDGRTVDVRMTALPTTHGEKLTARLFDPTTAIVDLEALGMTPGVLKQYRLLIARPRGCVLLTGPAGSGKTTTMYASLAWINTQSDPRSICTVEEPVEFQLSGVDQTDVNRDIGLDFASGLRTILRQDPQVIMVGEIRDPETAEIAVRAGLTGHLIFKHRGRKQVAALGSGISP